MHTVKLSPALFDRLRLLAEADGLSVDAFVERGMTDVVEWAQRTNAELDGGPVNKPMLYAEVARMFFEAG